MRVVYNLLCEVYTTLDSSNSQGLTEPQSKRGRDEVSFGCCCGRCAHPLDRPFTLCEPSGMFARPPVLPNPNFCTCCFRE